MDYTNLYNFITPSGIIVPNDTSVLSGTQTKFQEIFGADIDLSAETPVGRLIEAYAVLEKSTLGINAQSANQFNINESTGIYLDAIAQIFGLKRIAATKTRISIKCYFKQNTAGLVIIPAGSLLLCSGNGATFSIDTPISNEITKVDDVGEYAVGTATATRTGVIEAPAGYGYSIQTAVMGWSGIACEATLYTGTDLEPDNEFRQRILDTRPIGIGFVSHLVSAIKRLDGVFSCCILENNTGNNMIKKGVSIPPHSIFVGIDCIEANKLYADIAGAISRAKPIGVGMVHSDIEGATLIEREIQYGYAEAYMQPIYFYKVKKTPIKVVLEYTFGNYTGEDVLGDIEQVVIAYIGSIETGGTISAPMISNQLIKQLNIGVGMIWLYKDGSAIPADVQVKMDGYEAPYTTSGNIIANQIG